MKKSKTRIFLDKTISSNLMVYIKGKQHHFLKNVLRVEINDEINIFDGKTGEWLSVVMSINRDNTVLRVKKNILKFKESKDFWLIFCPIKQHKMNLAIQKATEIGATKFIPCITEYTNIRNINLNSLFYNVVEAAEQSERLDIPKIENQTSLDLLFSNWPESRTIIFCDERLSSEKSIINTLLDIKDSHKKFAVLVGPEGGFSDKERELISKNKNIISVSLGNKVLRSDTAITVSLFCIQQLLS